MCRGVRRHEQALSNFLKPLLCVCRCRHSAVPARNASVAVLGAAGGIGQPMSLLLKNNPLVTELGVFDVFNTPGVAADLSHCNTPAKVGHGSAGEIDRFVGYQR